MSENVEPERRDAAEPRADQTSESTTPRGPRLDRERAHELRLQQSKLIRRLEKDWAVKERETAKAVQKVGKPHGLLGKLGFNTATG